MARPRRAGRIGRPHGLDGSVHVVEPVSALLVEGTSVLVDDRSVAIVRRAGSDERPIVRLEGCADRAAAEALRGRELFVPQDAEVELEEDEWWIEDLEGCSVWDGAARVGEVRRVRPLPSCEVLEVAREGAEDLLVPLVRDAVRNVDVEARRIDVDLEFLGE
jgi:16S rRNA processing protein RimM